MSDKIDYERVMALGSWLGRFLTNPLSPWDIEELADDALKLLNIDYVREGYDPVVNGIMTLLEEYDAAGLSTIDDLSDELKNAFDKHADRAITGAAPVLAGKDLSSIASSVRHEIENTFYLRGLVTELIQWLSKEPDTPWEYVLSLASEEKGKKANPLQLLMLNYNKIRDMMIESGRKVELVRCMSGQVVGGKVEKSNRCRVEFPSLFSRIFIDFLVVGGRDYCCLCKHCGKFVLAERRGRRQYCSGRCRIAYKRKKDKGD